MTWIGLALIALGSFFVMVGTVARPASEPTPSIIVIPAEPEPSHGGPLTPSDFDETPRLGSPTA